jgi:hypothetical protein
MTVVLAMISLPQIPLCGGSAKPAPAPADRSRRSRELKYVSGRSTASGERKLSARVRLRKPTDLD